MLTAKTHPWRNIYIVQFVNALSVTPVTIIVVREDEKHNWKNDATWGDYYYINFQEATHSPSTLESRLDTDASVLHVCEVSLQSFSDLKTLRNLLWCFLMNRLSHKRHRKTPTLNYSTVTDANLHQPYTVWRPADECGEFIPKPKRAKKGTFAFCAFTTGQLMCFMSLLLWTLVECVLCMDQSWNKLIAMAFWNQHLPTITSRGMSNV